MMNWDGNGASGWLVLIPMLLVIWAAISLVVLPRMRPGRDRAALADRPTG